MKRRNRTKIKPLRAVVVSRTNRVADHLRSNQLTAHKTTTARTTVKIIIVRTKIDLFKANAYQTKSIAIIWTTVYALTVDTRAIGAKTVIITSTQTEYL